jgi:hypothetical protein
MMASVHEKRNYQNKKPKKSLSDLVFEKIRNCLKCDREFRSCGPENRLCGRCNFLNQSVYIIRSSETKAMDSNARKLATE